MGNGLCNHHCRLTYAIFQLFYPVLFCYIIPIKGAMNSFILGYTGFLFIYHLSFIRSQGWYLYDYYISAGIFLSILLPWRFVFKHTPRKNAWSGCLDLVSILIIDSVWYRSIPMMRITCTWSKSFIARNPLIMVYGPWYIIDLKFVDSFICLRSIGLCEQILKINFSNQKIGIKIQSWF